MRRSAASSSPTRPRVSMARVRAAALGQALEPAGQFDQLAARSSSRSSAGPGPGPRPAAGRRARSGRRSCRRSRPCRPSAGRGPVMSRSVVVLPAPFGPSRPNTEPRGTSRSSAVEGERRRPGPPNRFDRPRQLTAVRRSAHRSSRPTAKYRIGPSRLTNTMISPHMSLLSPRTCRSGRSRSRRARTSSPSWIAMTGSRSRTIWRRSCRPLLRVDLPDPVRVGGHDDQQRPRSRR